VVRVSSCVVVFRVCRVSCVVLRVVCVVCVVLWCRLMSSRSNSSAGS
jgi:hypothetical protein